MADDDNDDVTVNSVESRITSIQVKRGNHDEPLALKTEGGLLLCTTTNRRRRIIILGVLVVVAVAISVGAIVIHVLRQGQQQEEGNNNKKSNAVVAATLETNGEITSMDLAGNGRVMAVATTLRNYEPAIVYVYEWLQEQEQEWVVPRGKQIKTYNHQVQISLSYNGTSLAIGSAEGSTVCFYDLQNENEWTKTQCITQDNAGFGAFVKYGNDRNILAACGFTFCQVYEYNQTTTKTTTTSWVPRGPRFHMSDSAGFVMDLSMTNNGDTLLISTRNNTQIYSWHEEDDDMSYYKPKGQPLQGRSWRNHYSWAILAPTNGSIVALQSLDESRDPRMDGSGVIVVYVYEFVEKHKAWMQKRNEVATGYAFAISGNGSMVAVAKKAFVRNEEEAEFSTSRAAGGHDSNTVGIFEWNKDNDDTTTWSEIYSLSGNPRFLDIADSGKVVALANHDDIAVYRLESI